MEIFSIVVPVYNVEKYLLECIKSIEQQINKNFEIILVNDGSKDNSGKICESLSQKFNNIKVIHKLNGGLSDARNEGIKVAKGEYVLFCDSDDLWNDIELLNKAKNCIEEYSKPDIILFSGKKFFEETGKKIYDKKMDCEKINIGNIPETLEYLINSGTYSMSACTKIVRRKFIMDNKLFFTKGLLGEDLDWFISITLIAKKICAIESYNYYYRIRKGSITQTINSKYIRDFLWILDKWIPKLKQEKYLGKSLLGILAYSYMTNLMNLLKIDKNEKKILLKRYKDYQWLLNYSENKRICIVRIIIRILGITPVANLLKIYYSNFLSH